MTRDSAKDGRNWYVYCEGNPVNNADWRGLDTNGIELGFGGAFIFGGSISIGIGVDSETGHWGITIEAGIGLGVVTPGVGVSGTHSSNGVESGFGANGTVSGGVGPLEFEIPFTDNPNGENKEGGIEIPPENKWNRVGLMAEAKVSATLDVTEYIEREREDWDRSEGSNFFDRLWDYITKPNQDWRNNLREGIPMFARRHD